jgi:hypothetical protein
MKYSIYSEEGEDLHRRHFPAEKAFLVDDFKGREGCEEMLDTESLIWRNRRWCLDDARPVVPAKETIARRAHGEDAEEGIAVQNAVRVRSGRLPESIHPSIHPSILQKSKKGLPK